MRECYVLFIMRWQREAIALPVDDHKYSSLIGYVKSKMKTSEEAGVSKSIQAVFDPGLGIKALKVLELII